MIRSFRQDIKVVFGGVHPTLFPREMAEQESIDHVVFGEGERTIGELADCLLRGKEPEGILGVAFKMGGRVIMNAPRPLIENLDTLPHPAYDLLPFSRYRDPLASHAPCTTMCRSFYLRPSHILNRMITLNRHVWKMNLLGLLKLAGLT